MIGYVDPDAGSNLLVNGVAFVILVSGIVGAVLLGLALARRWNRS